MKPSDYLTLEFAIANKVLAAWDNPAQSIAQAVYLKEYDKAREIVLNLAIPLNGLSPYIEVVTKTCANFGASMAQAKMSHNLQDDILSLASDNLEKAITLVVADNIKQKWLSAISTLQENPDHFQDEKPESGLIVVQKSNTKKKSFIEDFISFGDNSEQMVRMLSGLHTNRLATWGFLGEATYLNFEKYRLSAIIDSKTSYFCEHIANGKEFYVIDAKDLITRALSVEPQDLKSIQPWVKSTKANLKELEALSNEELVQRGLHVPPFHPWCRTILMRVDASKYYFTPSPTKVPAEFEPEEGISATITDLPLFSQLKKRKEDLNKKTLDALNVKGSKKAVEAFNEATDTELVDTLASILGQDSYTFTEITSKKFTQKIKVATEKAVKIQVEDEGIEVSITINKLDSVIKVNYIKLNGGLQESIEKLKNTLKGITSVGQANGIATLQVATKGVEAALVSSLGLTAVEVGVVAEDMRRALQTLKNLGVSIPEGDLQALIAIINSPKFSTYGLQLIARYPLTIGKKSIAEILFANTKILANVDLTNADSIKKFIDGVG